MKDGDITTGAQIDSYLRKYFPSNIYRGIVVNDEIPTLKSNQFVINNKRVHWSLIYNKDGLKEFDSYGRDMIPEIKDTYVLPSNRQGYGGVDLSDCGQRSISKAIQIFKPTKFFS